MMRSTVMAPRFLAPSGRTIALACAIGVAGCAAAPTRDQEALSGWLREGAPTALGSVQVLLDESYPAAGTPPACLAPDEEQSLARGLASDSDVAGMAVRCNPEIEAGVERARAALAEAEARSYLPDLSARYEANATPIRQPWRLDRTAMHLIGLSQEFPLGPVRSLASRVSADEGIRHLADRARAALELTAMVQSDLATARATRDQEAILERHITTVDRLIAIATVRYRSGRGMAEDITRFRVERGHLLAGRYDLRRVRAAALARVNAALGRTVTAPIEPANAGQDVRDLPDPAALLARLEEVSPVLLALRAEVRAAEGEEALARAEAGWPSLMVSGSYNIAPQMPDSVTGMVSLNLPWLNPARAARERAAAARMAAARRMYDRRRDELASRVIEVGERLRGLHDSERLLRDRVLPDARATLDLALATYQSGLGDFTGVLEAERALLTVEMRLVEIALQWAIARALLRALVGGEGGDS